MKLALVLNRNVCNLQRNKIKRAERIALLTRIWNIVSTPYSIPSRILYYIDPKLRDERKHHYDNSFITYLILLPFVFTLLLVVFFLFFFYPLFNGLLSLLPQPAHTVELPWLPLGHASMSAPQPLILSNPIYKHIQRFAYAEGLPWDMVEDFLELLENYKEEEERREKKIEEARDAKERWLQAVYLAEGNRLDQEIREAEKEKRNWVATTVSNVPSKYANYTSPIPGEFSFVLKTIRLFFSRFTNWIDFLSSFFTNMNILFVSKQLS